MISHMVSMIVLVGSPWLSSLQAQDTMNLDGKGPYGGSVSSVEFKNGQFGIILRDDTEGNPPSKEIPMHPNAKIPTPPIGGTEKVAISDSTEMLQIGERARVTLTKGADVGYLVLAGNADVLVEEGAHVAHVDVSDVATLRISSGATVSHLTTHENSTGVTVLVEEKAEIAHITVAGHTTLRLSGAVVSHLTVQDNSTAYITGGALGFLNLEGKGQAHIHGSTLKEVLLSIPEGSFLGGGITYTPETRVHLYATDVTYRGGRISGTWHNGEYFSLSLVGVELDKESGRKPLPQQPTTLPPQVVIPTHVETSFDCTRATSRTEKMICRDPALASLDQRLSRLYREVLETSPDFKQIKASQRHWLHDIRNGCTTIPCIRAAYERRIATLAKMSKKPQ